MDIGMISADHAPRCSVDNYPYKPVAIPHDILANTIVALVKLLLS